MPVLDSVNKFYHGVYDHLPLDTGKALLYSGLFTFVACTIRTANVEYSLLVGTIAATCALISALTAPLFQKAFGRNYLSWYEHCGKMIVNLAVTQVLINSLTTLRTNLVGSVVLTCGLDLLFNGLGRRPTNSANTFIFF